jgi:purine-binding chemotaxis protein CheW
MIMPNKSGASPSSSSRAAITEILKIRARALARRPNDAAATGRLIDVIEFKLAGERYAIEQTYVREVVPLKELTPLPCTPPFMRGIVNVRGQIVPVIDIKRFFELPEGGIADVHMLVIVQCLGCALGLEADAVMGVRAIDPANMQPSLPTLTGIRAQYLKGVTNEQVVILDALKILGDPKIVVDDEVE